MKTIKIFISIIFLLTIFSLLKGTSNAGDPALKQAVEKEDTVEIETLLKEMNAETKLHLDSNRPLIVAINIRNKSIVKLLINYGADVNKKYIFPDDEGKTYYEYPIHNTIKESYAKEISPEIIKLLVTNGADIEARDMQGNTPLLLALVRNKLKIAKLFIDLGADIYTKNKRGHTALQFLAFNGLYLDEHKKQVATKSSREGISNQRQHSELLSKLFSGPPVNTEERTKKIEAIIAKNDPKDKEIIGKGYALAAAILRRNIDNIRILIKHGADVNKAIEREEFMQNYSSRRPPMMYRELSNLENLILRKAQTKTPISIAFTLKDPTGINIAKLLIENGADVNQTTRHGETPLFFAKTATQIKLLIDNGADINKQKFDGMTVLLHAAGSNNHELTQMLITAGADKSVTDSQERNLVNIILNDSFKTSTGSNTIGINETNLLGQTPLMYLVTKENPDIDKIKTLIILGADPSIKDNNNAYPIMHASQNNYVDILEIMASNASPEELNRQDGRGMTLLMHTLIKNDTAKAIELINSGVNTNLKNKRGQDTLTLASYHCNPEITRLLIKKGADVNNVSKYNESAIINTAYAGCAESMRVLLEAGTNIETTDLRGKTPLMIAVLMGDKSLLNLLIKQNANTNATGNSGDSPLIKAYNQSKFSIAKVLIENGANKNNVKLINKDVLNIAIRTATIETLNELINNGIDINEYDSYEVTPLMTAVNNGNFEALKILIQNQADINKTSNYYIKDSIGSSLIKYKALPILDAIRNGKTKTVNYLLDNGAKVDAEKLGNTFLKSAIISGKVSMVEKVLELGIKIKNDNNSYYLLENAVNTDNSLMIDKLISAGTDINSTNGNGQTALMYTVSREAFHICEEYECWGPSINNLEMVKSLIKNGADITITNKSGKTAYDIGINNYHIEELDDNNKINILNILKIND